jgi:hypothetical protein|tara:strand:- start:825 stop:1007 length:183 start_codon:yes stop_codon:yes gene_type:complete
MGFNKRFITKEIIEMTEDNYIDNLFNSDALIFGDDWSYEFYKLFLEGVEIDEIKEKIIKI